MKAICLEQQEETTLLADATWLKKFVPQDENDIKRLDEPEQKLKGIEENTTQSLSRNPGDLNRKSGNHTSYNGNITSAMH